MPKNEDASEFELQNEASTGVMRGLGTGGVEDTTNRRDQDSTNFYRGMFALMASYDWDRGQFSEHPRDIDLKNEAFELLNLPPHLSSQFSKDKADEFLQSLGTVKRSGKYEGFEETSRSTDYVQNLIRLSRARFGNKKIK